MHTKEWACSSHQEKVSQSINSIECTYNDIYPANGNYWLQAYAICKIHIGCKYKFKLPEITFWLLRGRNTRWKCYSRLVFNLFIHWLDTNKRYYWNSDWTFVLASLFTEKMDNKSFLTPRTPSTRTVNPSEQGFIYLLLVFIDNLNSENESIECFMEQMLQKPFSTSH